MQTLLLIVLAQARPLAPNPIMGGSEVRPGEYAWLVNRNLKCGGSLITNQWILTAGHCAFEVGDFVTLNKLNLFGAASSHEEIISVSQSFAHPKFQRSATEEENDIRLVKLSIASEVAPARLATVEEAQILEQPGTLLTVAGWGALEEGGDIAGRLREVELPVVANTVCADSEHYAKVRRIYDTMLCAGYAAGGRDACAGDSGSPLFKEVNGQGVILGITSWGVGCGRPNRPGVYTRVSKYRDWIGSVLNGSYVSPPTSPSVLLSSPVSSFVIPTESPLPPFLSVSSLQPTSLGKTPDAVPSIQKSPTLSLGGMLGSASGLSSVTTVQYLQPLLVSSGKGPAPTSATYASAQPFSESSIAPVSRSPPSLAESSVAPVSKITIPSQYISPANMHDQGNAYARSISGPNPERITSQLSRQDVTSVLPSPFFSSAQKQDMSSYQDGGSVGRGVSLLNTATDGTENLFTNYASQLQETALARPVAPLMFDATPMRLTSEAASKSHQDASKPVLVYTSKPFFQDSPILSAVNSPRSSSEQFPDLERDSSLLSHRLLRSPAAAGDNLLQVAGLIPDPSANLEQSGVFSRSGGNSRGQGSKIGWGKADFRPILSASRPAQEALTTVRSSLNKNRGKQGR